NVRIGVLPRRLTARRRGRERRASSTVIASKMAARDDGGAGRCGPYPLAFRFFGTLAPAARASDQPLAVACLRPLALRPGRPLFNVPALRFFMARPTFADAFLEYFRVLRAMQIFS